MERPETSVEEGAVLIRDFRRSDLEDLLDLLPKCFAEEFEVTGFDLDHARDLVNRAFGRTGRLLFAMARLSGGAPIKFLVAESRNRVVGTTIVSNQGPVGYISTVMVHPDFRRKGIASRLVKNAVEYTRRNGKARAVLHVVSTNAPAIGVYSKLGFEPFERVANLLGDADLGSPQAVEGVEIRPYQDYDLDKVYDLIKSLADESHLRIFGFDKNELKTPFWLRLLHLATEKRFVALRAGEIVGYVSATYTTPKEAANINSVQVKPEEGLRDVEEALLKAAVTEIRKGGVGKIRVMVPTTRERLIETLGHLGFTEKMEMDGMFKENLPLG